MEVIEKLNQLIEEEIARGAFPGANYAIVFKDSIYYGSLGNKRLLPNHETNSLDTIYDMASLSKVVSTTSCIMKLLELGKLRLFTKVKTYIPEFKHHNVSIWHLITHTSGLPEGLRNILSYHNKKEIIDAICQSDLVYEPGTKISYSDLGFIMLGEIVEKVSGMPLNEFAEKYIFKPLDMNDTGYNPKDINRCAPTEERHDVILDGIVQGKVHDETSYLMGGVAGHAGLFSTVLDVSHFVQMILNEGVYEGNRVFEKNTIDRLFVPEVTQKTGVMVDEVTRGLGWVIASQAGPNGDLTSKDTIHHTGFTGTSIWIDRQNEIGFCLLTNRVHPTRANISHMDARGRISNFIMSNFQKLK